MTDKPSFFDEMYGFGETARAPYSAYSSWFNQEDVARLRKKSEQAEAVAGSARSRLSLSLKERGLGTS